MDQIFLQNLYCWFFSKHVGHAGSAANKGRSSVNYPQSLTFDRLYLSCNDHCDRWFFQEIFFIIIFRSSHTHIFFKTGVVRNFAIFTGKQLCWSFFLIKLQVFQPRPKRDFNTGDFNRVKIASFLRTGFIFGTLLVAAIVNLIK